MLFFEEIIHFLNDNSIIVLYDNNQEIIDIYDGKQSIEEQFLSYAINDIFSDNYRGISAIGIELDINPYEL